MSMEAIVGSNLSQNKRPNYAAQQVEDDYYASHVAWLPNWQVSVRAKAIIEVWSQLRNVKWWPAWA